MLRVYIYMVHGAWWYHDITFQQFSVFTCVNFIAERFIVNSYSKRKKLLTKMTSLGPSPCACCLPLEYVYLAGLLATGAFFWFRKRPSNKNQTFTSKLFDRVITYSFTLLILVCGVVLSSKEVQKFIFSKVCLKLVQSTKLDSVRCGLVSGVQGRVLELGPGPGTNFRW